MSNMQQNPYLLTLPQLISAKRKISQVAAFYDPTKYSMKGFDSVALDATEFREQLSRNFRIKLTDAELGAIVFLFDQDGDGKVDSVEFINEFLKLGNEEKSRMRYIQSQSEQRIERLKHKIVRKREKQYEKLTAVKVATSWSELDETSAIKKIAKVAFTYDSMKGGLEGFLDCDSLSPAEFKEQLRRVFKINLSAEETAALANIFDKYHIGEVDCKEFVYQFFRIRRNEIDSHQARQELKTARKNAEEEKRKADMIDRYCKLAEAKITEATEEERKTALEKIRLAAAYYKKNPFVDTIQKSFESEELSPTAFKEMLKNNFEIRLSSGELDAVVKLFDLNRDGNISCVEFMTTFFKIGMNERSRMFQNKKYRDEQLLKAQMKKDEMLVQESINKTKTKVIYPVLPAFDDVFAIATLAVPTPKASFMVEGSSADHSDNSDHSDNEGEDDGGDSFITSSTSTKSHHPKAHSLTQINTAVNAITLNSASQSNANSPGSVPTLTTPVPASPSRRTRKMSTIDILSPDKFAAKLASTSRSLTALYPRASNDTKDFILHLEEKERLINNMRTEDVSRKQPLPGTRSRLHTPATGLQQQFGLGSTSGTSGSASVMSGASGADGSGSGSSMSMTNKKMQRRPSKKPSMHYNGGPSLPPTSSTGGTKLPTLSRSSTGDYSTDDFSFPQQDIQQDEYHYNPSQHNSFLTSGQDSEYVEVEATLPPEAIDFEDRPRTVHSNVRPPSREKDGSTLMSARSSVNIPEIVMDGYNL